MIKIPDTLQQVFDIVSQHLLKQRVKSMSVLDGTCLYRGPNGLKCAAGALIPDEEFIQLMDLIGSWFSLVEENLVESKFVQEIAQLQSIHDSGLLGTDNSCYDDWKNKLTKFAQDNNLIFKGE